MRPSERPIVKSAMVRGFMGRLEGAEVVGLGECFSFVGWSDAVGRLCGSPVSVNESAV